MRVLIPAAAVALVACTAPDGKAPATDEFDLRKADWVSTKILVLGSIAPGETKSFDYVNPPLYRAYTVASPAGGMRFFATVSGAGDADPVAWLLDSRGKIVDENDDIDPSTYDSQIVVPRLAEGSYSLIIREYARRSASFTVRLASSSSVVDGGVVDGQVVDAGVADAGVADGRPHDGGTPDASTPDAGPSLAGSYRVETSIDLRGTQLPAPLAEIVAAFIDISDSPSDPGTWLLDSLRDTAGTDVLKDFRPALDAFLKQLFDQRMTTQGAIRLSQSVASVATRFGLKSRLDLVGVSSGGFSAKQSIDGVFFVVGDRRYDVPFAIYAVAEGRATLSGSQLSLEGFSFGIPWGAIAAHGVAEVVTPVLDPRAASLRDLLYDLIDCAGTSVDMADFTGVLDAGFYESLCDTGLAGAATVIQSKLDSLADTPGTMTSRGSALVLDLDGDGRVDRLAMGAWDGTAALGGQSFSLFGHATFLAQRSD